MTTSIQPGWYDDPEDPNGQRYWDGQTWTPHRQRKPISTESSAPNLPPPPPSQQAYVPPPPPPYQQAPWGPPGYPAAGPPARKSNNAVVLVAALVGIAVLAIGGFFAYQHFSKSSSSSPEDQIKALVQQEVDDYNRSSMPAFNPQLECKANTNEYQGDDPDQLRRQRAQAGDVTASVTNIQVTGDQATGDLTFKFANLDQPVTSSGKFVKEDGRWKDCSPSPGGS
jgi:uncharacterized protein DUF2510